MKRYDPIPNRRSASRRGFTLIELVVSVAISGILMAAIGSAMFIATRTMRFDSPVDHAWQTGPVVDQIADDLHVARSFSVADPTTVTFTVPDRDGDLASETITYSWSGVAGDPLVRTYNGQSTNILEDVHSFNLTYLSRP